MGSVHGGDTRELTTPASLSFILVPPAEPQGILIRWGRCDFLAMVKGSGGDGCFLLATDLAKSSLDLLTDAEDQHHSVRPTCLYSRMPHRICPQSGPVTRTVAKYGLPGPKPLQGINTVHRAIDASSGPHEAKCLKKYCFARYLDHQCRKREVKHEKIKGQ